MKSVCFVIDELSNGGSERVVSILANNLIRKGVEVSILLLHGDRKDYEIDDKVIIRKHKKVTTNKIGKLFSLVIFLIKTIKELSPHVIISFDSYNNIVTLFANFFIRKKIIISERNDPNQYPSSKWIRMLRDKIYKTANGIVFQTSDARKYFDDIISDDKSVIISNPLLENLPYWVSSDTKKNIIVASRLTKQKNLPMVIDAFKLIYKDYPDYKLKVYGRGPLEGYLTGYIKEKGLKGKVQLMGYTDNIHEEMSISSLYINSSNYEGISNSMLEALAIGVPVIATNAPIGGAKMFIKDNVNGFLVEVGDEIELANKIREIFKNPSLARSFSNESQKIRDELNVSKITNEWMTFINRVIFTTI